MFRFDPSAPSNRARGGRSERAQLGHGHTMDAAGQSRASRGLSLHRRSQSREWRMLGRRGRRKREMDWLIRFASTSRVLP